MIQDVKLGTIGTYMYAIMCSCSAFVGKLSFFKKKTIKTSNNVGVERGVATRRAQMVWPMMTGYCDKF